MPLPEPLVLVKQPNETVSSPCPRQTVIKSIDLDCPNQAALDSLDTQVAKARSQLKSQALESQDLKL